MGLRMDISRFSRPVFSFKIRGFVLKPYVRTTAKSLHARPECREYGQNKAQLIQLLSYKSKGKIEFYPVKLGLIYHCSSSRALRFDMDNVQKAVMDALQGAGIISNDNAKHVSGVVFCDVGKAAPGEQDYLSIELFADQDRVPFQDKKPLGRKAGASIRLRKKILAALGCFLGSLLLYFILSLPLAL